jgi:hypothetical protein
MVFPDKRKKGEIAFTGLDGGILVSPNPHLLITKFTHVHPLNIMWR